MRTTEVKQVDPVEERKKLQTSFFRRLLITQWHFGSGIKKDIPFGHYMFCGPQGSGKTASCLWYFEYLSKKYKRKGFKVGHVYSNFGIGKDVTKATLFPTIFKLAVKKDGSSRYKKSDKIINFILLDEFHSYFPKDFSSKEDKELIKVLISRFSQLRKAHLFILSTAQVYGSLDKRMREQCLYMINNRKSHLSNWIISEFYKQEDILCDELGRWSGIPSRIHSHGLPKTVYDTSRLVNE